jgi:L-rhamnose mutarotase
MKITDIERNERERRRARKKQERMEKLEDKKEGRTVGDFIKDLSALFFHDEEKIYNIKVSEEIAELMTEMCMELPEEKWNDVIKKAVKKTGVKQKSEAQKELDELLQG